MPQLNPSPWLPIMLLIWTTILTVFLDKTLALKFPNGPTMKKTETSTTSWTWPWY